MLDVSTLPPIDTELTPGGDLARLPTRKGVPDVAALPSCCNQISNLDQLRLPLYMYNEYMYPGNYVMEAVPAVLGSKYFIQLGSS